jgi:2-polyprenyl-6-methoxyphenol hydroxylase-like FAD-dependent oxidoreductase
MVLAMDILISGASVAGPALAYWLTRHGFNVTVVERSPGLRGGGYAVDFRGAAHLGVRAVAPDSSHRLTRRRSGSATGSTE